MPDLGPLGRGGARRRTRRRMVAVNEMSKQEEPSRVTEEPLKSDDSDKLRKLARLLKDKGVITEEEYNLIFD
jgi:hypothetical protein